jgi:hypothetical protein
MQARGDTTNLADLLERILDKGIVIAGDISISLVDIELLTIKLRLLIASVDKAREMGVNWWESDPWLTGRTGQQAELPSPGPDRRELEERLDRIEQALGVLAEANSDGGGR